MPGAASIPAANSRHAVMATLTGKRIVDMVWEDLKPSDLITDNSIHNAVVAVLAIGGSTNAAVHLIALARRAGLALDLMAFDSLARETPLLANIRPSGAYLMEDFFYAGGLPAVLKQLALGGKLKLGARTVNGSTIGENIEPAKTYNDDVIRPLNNPVVASDSLAVLRGNLAPDGAIIKPPAAEPRLRKHAGKAVVFEDYNDMATRIDDPDLDADENSVLVLKNAGPLARPACRSGAVADSEEAPGQRRPRHGSRFGCAHERHELRRVRIACRSGILRRRPARPGQGWRCHRTRHSRTSLDLERER